MKLEVATSYRIGEIANTASVLVDEIVRTEIDGTNLWPALKDPWLAHIRGVAPQRFDLLAKGLKLAYRGYPENIRHMERRGISILFDEPRIIIFADEEVLSVPHVVGLTNISHEIAGRYNLREDLVPPSLVFPKEGYAKEIVVFDSNALNVH
jgi:hypothetical protein